MLCCVYVSWYCSQHRVLLTAVESTSCVQLVLRLVQPEFFYLAA